MIANDEHRRFAVYRYVRERIEHDLPVNLTNAGYGTQRIGAALRIDPKAVKFVLAGLVLQEWLEKKGAAGYGIGRKAPSVAELEAMPPQPRSSLRHTTTRLDLPAALLERMGVQTEGENVEPLIMLDWALRWAKQSIHVFPCRRYLGIPLVQKWYAEATTRTAQIVDWWAASPEADIAGVPDQSGHFVIVSSGDEGADRLAEIEREHGPLPADFRYLNRTEDSEHLWLKGRAITSHNRLGSGLHVLGAGHFVYLPVSWAPDHHWKEETHA
jgi:hypothetical protein